MAEYNIENNTGRTMMVKRSFGGLAHELSDLHKDMDSRVHPSFPPQGEERKASEGSQSMSPTKEEDNK